MTDLPSPADITLGLLAGGRATRLGGLDKAWLQRAGVPQVLRWRDRFAGEVCSVLVSANRDLPRYRATGLDVVADAVAADIGPIAGLSALAGACRTRWLLTVPVDVVEVDPQLVQALARESGGDGAFACDDDGIQPLVALWRVAALRPVVAAAIGRGDGAVHALQGRLDMSVCHFPRIRFGNLNSPADLAAAGIPPTSKQP